MQEGRAGLPDSAVKSERYERGESSMMKKQKIMLYRIIAAAVIYVPLFVLEHMGKLEFKSEIPVQFLLFMIPYLIVGWDIIYRAVRNISHGQVFDENFLMCIATFGALGVKEYSEAVAVMLFYQIGELFQSYAVNRSRQSISDLMDICPEYANIEEDGQLKQVDPDDVSVGDIIVIKAGERIPLDGRVISGDSMIDTSALTGESVPRRVRAGDEMISGCVNGSGLLRVEVTKEFDDSTVARILELVENASSKKAPVENFITRFARYYTPVVVIAAVVLAILPPLFFGQTWSEGIRRACTFLVISCPCALVISVPMSFFSGIGAASKKGVLVKGSNYLEALANVHTVVFEKTGTLTKGEFKVTGIYPSGDAAQETIEKRQDTDKADGWSASQLALLELAALAESSSDHPVSRSIREAWGHSFEHTRIADAEEIPGHGIRVKADVTDKSPGFKFAEQEMRGIPIRVECGPKDIENGQAVLCRRDTREKYTVSFEELADKVKELLDTIQHDMLERARAHRESHTYVAKNYEEFGEIINSKPGFIKAMWCGDRACEDKIKEDFQATSRCMPFEQEQLSDVCVCCGKPAKKMVYWGRAY